MFESIPAERMKTLREISFVEPDKCSVYVASQNGDGIHTLCWLEPHPLEDGKFIEFIRFSSEEFERELQVGSKLGTIYLNPINHTVGQFIRAAIVQPDCEGHLQLRRMAYLESKVCLIEFVDQAGRVFERRCDGSNVEFLDREIAKIVGGMSSVVDSLNEVTWSPYQRRLASALISFLRTVIRPLDPPIT
jgi:hypothetical protein